jgi:hypothetical protein
VGVQAAGAAPRHPIMFMAAKVRPVLVAQHRRPPRREVDLHLPHLLMQVGWVTQPLVQPA